MRNRFQHAISIVLILAVAALLVFVSGRYTWDADWTHGNRNSLTDASRRVLDALPGQIEFTAYAFPGPMRESIRSQVERYQRYQRYRDDIVLRFVDPAKNPQKVRELGISGDGEVRVSYQGRTRTLDDLTEQTVTNALQQLSVAAEQWVVFLTGHGERDTQDDGQGGYSELAAELARQGLKTRPLNLAESPRVPDNTAILVIASPQQQYLPGEVDIIRDYLARGGNLLWLDDPGRRYGLGPLAGDLGLTWREGTVIYPDYRELGTGHPAMALVIGYPKHPITERLASLTLFPLAGGLTKAEGNDGGWRQQAIVRTPERSWLEVGSLDAEQIAYDENSEDALGPITIGMALTRQVPEDQQPESASGENSPEQPKEAGSGDSGGADDSDTGDRTEQEQKREQRVVVMADSDFVANGHINSVGNMNLGVALFQWLANRDAQIAVQVPPAPDSALNLAPWHGRTIWLVFVVILPLALLGIGVIRWWVRRRR